MNETPFVMIVIPFKGQIQMVVNLINSIAEGYIASFSYSILLWDDGSTEEEIQLLKELTGGYFEIVRNQNVGYTKTVNRIVEFVKTLNQYHYLLLLNSDVLFEKQTFFSLVKRMNSNPNIAAVGCKVLKYGTEEILHTGTRLENGNIVDPYVGLHKNDPKTNDIERRLWVNGCSVLYNLLILRKENLNFDLEFSPAYFEEADLMSKLNLMGYSIMYEPRAVVQHIMNATHNFERDKYEKVFWENWEKYLNKWKSNFNQPRLEF